MTTLICIRHGQSEINLARRLTGQLDPPLTPLGVEQARRTAEFLRSQPITRIYSSDLVRCMDTAAPTAAMHGLPVIPEPAFREIFAGKWEGMTFDAITAAYTPGEAAVQALQAGCDVLLMPNSLPEAYAAVLEAVQNGTISEERLDRSVNKILLYKQQFAS